MRQAEKKEEKSFSIATTLRCRGGVLLLFLDGSTYPGYVPNNGDC